MHELCLQINYIKIESIFKQDLSFLVGLFLRILPDDNPDEYELHKTLGVKHLR